MITDEYMLVRKKDNAVVISRLMLSDKGLAESPTASIQGENNQLANSVNGWLKAEASGHVSFGRIK